MPNPPVIKRRRHPLIRPVLIGLSFSFPVVGFIYGYFGCEDCSSGLFGQLSRIFMGIIGAAFTSASLGRPWLDEAGTPGPNLRLYVFIAFVVIAAIVYLKDRKSNRSTK